MYVSLPTELSGLATARRVVASVLRSWDRGPSEIADAQLVTTELAADIIRHSDAQSYDLGIRADAERYGTVTVFVAAFGNRGPLSTPVPVSRPPAEVLSPVEDLSDDGWGPVLLSALSADWNIRTTKDRRSAWAALSPAADKAPVVL